MDSAKHTNSEANINSDLLAIYGEVNEIQRYEGEGIWNRFSILFSVNVILLGAVSFILSLRLDYKLIYLLVISISGLFMSCWAFYVLSRLWQWHRHWVKKLEEIETSFPKGLPKVFTDRPKSLMESSHWLHRHLSFAYTQPFMAVIIVLWLGIAVSSPILVGLSSTEHESSEAASTPPAQERSEHHEPSKPLSRGDLEKQ